ncbi:hypoxanthine-guanine phosphoribosyltransferase [Trypanosoma rangeli]|uniref:Hypoxanthine phosphoribosyltransferase n=1 Tax=Trypanosoma rangeli TaxID=5698 RepID=A0A422N3S1_TRYRA|nr:hypoxanthine-guanine phosphoribosyltransferase [Trypanosoma rangeli]RNF00094.1 hypoxanthine-guanine phosphoribosyltransferase [Trypanosoma rangeli]|eukprot:RNF00094.1 hypoxanthine-guanine phosphoribosyltransferase [Trypanosoma rangeli]
MPREYDFADKVLYTEEELRARINRVAQRIAVDYKDKGLRPLDNPLVLICVLKGSFMFTADLCRALSDFNVPVHIEFICVSSYGAGVTTSGQVRMLLDIRHSIEGRHAMIVEDIVDSALTLKYLQRTYTERRPASLKTVVLLDKFEGRQVKFVPDYTVASVPNVFVIGYGLDYDDSYREVRDIVVLRPEVYEKREAAQKKKLKEKPSKTLIETASASL